LKILPQVPDYKEIWLPAWKKIWKPIVISEWFPTPDHHDDHHHHHAEPAEHGWDRKDSASQSKVIWKRDNSGAVADAATALPSTVAQKVETASAAR
jgi:hypothetical protein